MSICPTQISCSSEGCEYIGDERTTDKCCPKTALDPSCKSNSKQESCLQQCNDWHSRSSSSAGDSIPDSVVRACNAKYVTNHDSSCWDSVGDLQPGNMCPSYTPTSGDCSPNLPGYGCASYEYGSMTGCKLQGSSPNQSHSGQSHSGQSHSGQSHSDHNMILNNHHKVSLDQNKVVIENTDGSNQKTLLSVSPNSVMLNVSGVSGDASSVTPVNLSHMLRSNGWGTASDFTSTDMKFCDPSCKCEIGQCGDAMLLVGLCVGIPLLLIIVVMAVMSKKSKGKK